MGKLFNYDGPVIRAMEGFVDLVILNLITFALCIPVVTAGAALTALNYSVLKIVRNEESYLIRSYFKSFRQNFRQATLLWLPMALLLGALAFDIYMIRTQPNYFPVSAQVVFTVGFIVIALVMVWIFPLLAHYYYDSVTVVIRNAVFLATSHLPRTLLMTAITALPLLFLYMHPYKMLFIVIILGMSLPAWLNAYLYNGVFKKMEKEREKNQENTAE